MGEKCDLCGSDRLERVYVPDTSARGLQVFLCRKCSLVQSLPRVDVVADRTLAVSSGADWGNIRYGKGFRTDAAIELLQEAMDLSRVTRVLDVGANRGSFVLRMHELAPGAEIVAVEPDKNVMEEYLDVPGITAVNARIEDIELPEKGFDLVYCSHTLEHLRSPRDTLGRIRQAMTGDGVLFIEVPVIDFIGRNDVVEEWFIDKHLFHFSAATLGCLLRMAGFRPQPDDPIVDSENVTFVAIPAVPLTPSINGPDGPPVRKAWKLLESYRRTLEDNRRCLRNAARHIEHLSRNRRIVVWGAGRIFDSLVTRGELDTGCLAGLVDKYLVDFVSENHGCQVRRPEEIASLQPDLVVVASRAYYREISAALQSAVPDCPAIGLDELLSSPDQEAAPGLASGYQ